jgi:hypothetical protein
MMAVVPVCAGVVTESAGVVSCSTGWQLIQYQQVVPFDPSQLDPQFLGAAFGVGFLILVPVWAACMGVRYLISMFS